MDNGDFVMRNMTVISTAIGMLVMTTAADAQFMAKQPPAPAAAHHTMTPTKGSSYLSPIENACTQEERRDCNPGDVCHMAIRLTGQPAVKLLQSLKRKVKKHEIFESWGLTIYESNDGLLRCDETKKAAPFCDIWLNTKEVKIEPGAVCE
jgi:hypothetical protein